MLCRPALWAATQDDLASLREQADKVFADTQRPACQVSVIASLLLLLDCHHCCQCLTLERSGRVNQTNFMLNPVVNKCAGARFLCANDRLELRRIAPIKLFQDFPFSHSPSGYHAFRQSVSSKTP